MSGPEERALRIWIDADPALGVHVDGHPRDIDDAYVIIEALSDPQIELAGVSTVFGNAPVQDGMLVARELLAAKASTLTAQLGAAAAVDPADGYPVDGAVRAMAEALREGPLTLLAIGPLTNVASLVENFPEEARQIERCVIVVGRSAGVAFEIGGASGIPDFNFEQDWRAARQLLESGVPVAMTGFELSHRVAVTREDLAEIEPRNALTRMLVARSLPWLEHWLSMFPSDRGFHPWDSAALSFARRPELFVSEERGWRIRKVEPKGGGSPVPWLETGADLPGPRVEYCPDFAPGGGEAFVRAMLDAQR
jgi:pyrimidine-specific ribonucleoside hydrolase